MRLPIVFKGYYFVIWLPLFIFFALLQLLKLCNRLKFLFVSLGEACILSHFFNAMQQMPE